MSVLAGAAAGIALVDWLSSKGQQLTITDDITTSMTISATTNVVTECFQSAEGDQLIEIKEGAGKWSQFANEPCSICTGYLRDILTARTDLEMKAAERNPGYMAQVPNPNLVTQMITGGSDPNTPQTSAAALGPCTAMCFDIVAFNVAQSQRLTATTSCEVQDNITNNIQQSISTQIAAYLKNQQDFIGQLESAFTSNTESITNNLSSTMSQSITNNFVQDLHQSMLSSQIVSLRGNSILADNISQTFTGNMVGKMQVNNTVVDQLRQSAQYSISQTLLNKNDTIGDLTKDFLQVIRSMSTLLEDLTTQILIIVGAVIAAVMLVISSLYIFNKSFHSWSNDKLRDTTDAEIAHYNRMKTDPEYRAQINQEKINNRESKARVQATQAQTKREDRESRAVIQKLNEKKVRRSGGGNNNNALSGTISLFSGL